MWPKVVQPYASQIRVNPTDLDAKANWTLLERLAGEVLQKMRLRRIHHEKSMKCKFGMHEYMHEQIDIVEL